jgi:hypothetical protein
VKSLARRIVALYPLAYRRRYGEEIEALLDDSEVRASTVLDLAKGAATAHLRPLPGLADAVPAGERIRAGATGLLACWLLLSLAGLGFYKTTEDGGFHRAGEVHPVLGFAHLAVQLLAIAGSLAVIAAIVPLAGIALARSRRDREARGAALMAAASVAALAIVTAGLVVAARAGQLGDWAGLAVLVGWSAVAIAAGAGCVVAARRGLFAISLGRGRQRLLVGLGCVVAATMAAIAAVTALYLVVLLADAPGLAGEPNGPLGLLSVAVSLGIALVAMALATGLAGRAALRGRRALAA